MQKKSHIARSTVLLVILLVLAITVCFSEVYAWFYESTTAKANVSAGVLSFYFTTNGEFNKDVTITETSPSVTFSKTELKGMCPGQTMTVKLTLSNEGSNVGAMYQIKLKPESSRYPQDCLITVKNSANQGYNRNFVKQANGLVYPVAGSNTDIYSEDTTYAYLAAGDSTQVTLTIEWPMDYEDIPPTDRPTGFSYIDDTTKNEGDLAFMQESNAENPFKLVFEVTAQQVP